MVARAAAACAGSSWLLQETRAAGGRFVYCLEAGVGFTLLPWTAVRSAPQAADDDGFSMQFTLPLAQPKRSAFFERSPVLQCPAASRLRDFDLQIRTRALRQMSGNGPLPGRGDPTKAAE